MCILCGKPGMVHATDPLSAASDAQGSGGSFGASATAGEALSAAALPPMPSTMAAEVSFLTGLTSSNTVAGTSFWTWNRNDPATYSSTSWASKWGSTTPGTTGGTVTYWFDATSNWSNAEKTALTSALALWSAEASINFALAASAANADFVFKRGTDGGAYETGNQTTTTVGSSVMGSHTSGTYISIDTSVAGFGPIGGSFNAFGGYPYQTMMHEVGHLIGLGHGGAYNGNVNAATQQLGAYDTRLWTIMSYINPQTSSASYFGSYPVTGTNWGVSPDGYYYVPTTPMILDIVAVQ
ncbi:MAG: hypothetical protein IT537_03450 [Hyphomicrobiales bacterium]|nr:hypothetical protein [Hyphomicrobiales bacterium]